jgi:hypothetical protein
MGHGLGFIRWNRSRISLVVSSADCGEPGECARPVRWRRVAPVRKEFHNGSNKSEREPTNGRSTNYGRGHLVPAFRSSGRNFSYRYAWRRVGSGDAAVMLSNSSRTPSG